LPFEPAIGVLDPLEESISGKAPDCVGVLIDDCERWLQR
jgi:hypothetical protein